MMATVDRISNLPKNVTETILMYLPLRDAVRTSILSRYWRYEWSTLPQLVFGENCVNLPEDVEQSVYIDKLVKIVDNVLLLHRGPIWKFTLVIDPDVYVDIDRWVLFLSRNGIKELTLELWTGDDFYKLPSSLFACKEITYLELFKCNINPPAGFKGFSHLTALDLQSVGFSNNGLNLLIHGCPLLKKLILNYIYGCDYLKICAMNLVYLEIDVGFEDVYFEKTPLLAFVSINLEEHQVVPDGGVSRLVRAFGGLPRIETLELHGGFLQILSRGDVPVKLPNACRLKSLFIYLNFEDAQEMLAALCIFRSSPILQKLSIMVSEAKICTEGKNIFEANEDFNCFFAQLQIVEVTSFTGTKSELRFIEYILANAPVLELVRINFKAEVAGGALHIMSELLQFRRLSSKAMILCPFGNESILESRP